ncbi:MAG: OmpH family outer membrane protein [Pseudomonadota bacterium]
MNLQISGVLAAIFLWFQLAVSVFAQDIGVIQSSIVVMSSDRLFNETKLGQSYGRQLESQRDELIARNRKLEAELEAEEKELTEKRSTFSPEEFRELADAFDEKVQVIRRESERLGRDLERNRENAPFLFLRQVEPVLVELMRESGAVIVLERRNILLGADVIDVTDLAITRIDRALEQGRLQSPENVEPGKQELQKEDASSGAE